jgi:hypothetical protein
VKILAKSLLSSVFVFLPAVCCAQDDFNLLLGQINKVHRELQDRQFELEMKLQDQQKDIQNLVKRQDALEKSLENAKFDIEFLKSMRGFADTKTDDTSKKLNTVSCARRCDRKPNFCTSRQAVAASVPTTADGAGYRPVRC